MKELFLVHAEVDMAPALTHEWDARMTSICGKIKKYSIQTQMSLYNIGGAHNYYFASLLASRLEFPLQDVAQCSVLEDLEPLSLYESFNLSMDSLNQAEKNTVIMAITKDQLPLLIGWWLKLPFEKWHEWEFVTEPIGFHMLNVNKSGDRTIYKYNES